MSYFTEVRFDSEMEDQTVINEMLLAEARAYLSQFTYYAVDDIMQDLTKGLETGSTTISDLRSSDLTDIFRAVTKKYPKVTLYVSGLGEEPGDVWVRRFCGGKVTFKRWPFEIT